jgi:hypothetical protein
MSKSNKKRLKDRSMRMKSGRRKTIGKKKGRKKRTQEKEKEN